MIDSHCHLADEAFADDVEQVVSRAHLAGVTHALCVLAMNEPAEAARAPLVASLWPGIAFAIGVHPHQAGQFTAPLDSTLADIRGAIEALPNARALGEIGLDYHYDLSPRDIQRCLFSAQVRLAGEMHLPVVIHSREAEADTIAILEAAPSPVRGVLHCFTGSERMARWAVEYGLCVSFAGIVTFSNAAALREVARSLPLDRLLVETDCPYLAPVPFRGARNEPAHVVEVARAVAALREMPVERFDDVVARNFVELFGR